MECPFLRESRVRQCRCATVRKLIPGAVRPAVREICSTPGYQNCAVYRQHPQGGPVATGCPYLDESDVQYCAAAPVMKMIPYSESLLSRCGSDRYHYCDLYLALSGAGHQPGDVTVDDMLFPARLAFAPNHMWFDAGSGDTWHIGIDALLARVLRQVDRISFVTHYGTRRPSVVLTVGEVDLPLTFPYELPIGEPHTYLRAKPATLTEDPYGQGWLFEGVSADGGKLLQGPPVAAWMRSEVDRLSTYVHGQLGRLNPEVLNDGGGFADDLLSNLTREQALTLFDEFFSPYAKFPEEQA